MSKLLSIKISPWISEAFWVGFGLCAAVVALLVGTRFLTTLLSTAEYGKLALAISLTTLAVQIFGNPIGKTAVRFYAYYHEKGKLHGFMQKLGVSIAYASGGVVLIVLFVGVLGAWFNVLPGLYFVFITGIFAILMVFNRVAFALEDAARERRFRSILQGMFESGRFLFAIVLISFLAFPNAQNVLTGFVVAGIIAAIAHFIFLYMLLDSTQRVQCHDQKKIEISDVLMMRSFQFPLILSNACIWLVMMAERWTLNHFGNLGDVGGYAAVYQLSFMPMLIVSNFLVLFTEPILYQVVGTEQKTLQSIQAMQKNRLVAFLILFVSLIVFVVLLFKHQVIGYYFLGEEFRSYSWLFPWLLLSGGSFAAAQQLLLKLSVELRTGMLAVLWGAVAAIAVPFYIFSANYWQLKGIVATVVAINILFVIFLLFFSNIRKMNE